jgi:hypothetical protein
VAAANAEVIFTTEYGAPAESLAELSDNSRYLDGSQLYNTQPPGLPIPGGKGPLWYMAGRTVDLVDAGARMMGTYQVDANGFIIPQFQGGEDLASPTLTVGQAWTATFEPFSSIAQPGQDVGQRVKMRRIVRFMVYVQDSTGFLFAKLNGGPQTPTSPPLGTIMLVERVPAWNLGDNPILPPPRRASAFGWRPTGRSYDPRAAIIKDTPGPLTIMEAAMEITVNHGRSRRCRRSTTFPRLTVASSLTEGKTQSADEFKAAHAELPPRSAAPRPSSPTPSCARTRPRHPQTIDVIRAAGHADPTSPTTAAVGTTTARSGAAVPAAVGTQEAQADEDAACPLPAPGRRVQDHTVAPKVTQVAGGTAQPSAPGSLSNLGC